MEWFYAKDGRQLGPVTPEEMERLVNTGTITLQTLIWHDDLPEWQRYGRLFTPEGTARNIPITAVKTMSDTTRGFVS